jgi:hypothetical protein
MAPFGGERGMRAAAQRLGANICTREAGAGYRVAWMPRVFDRARSTAKAAMDGRWSWRGACRGGATKERATEERRRLHAT